MPMFRWLNVLLGNMTSYQELKNSYYNELLRHKINPFVCVFVCFLTKVHNHGYVWDGLQRVSCGAFILHVCKIVGFVPQLYWVCKVYFQVQMLCEIVPEEMSLWREIVVSLDTCELTAFKFFNSLCASCLKIFILKSLWFIVQFF